MSKPHEEKKSQDVEMKTEDDESRGSEESTLDESSDVITQNPLLSLADDLFLVASADTSLSPTERETLLRSIESRLREGRQSGWIEFLLKKVEDAATSEVSYKYLTEYHFSLTRDDLKKIEEVNEKTITAADAKITEAEQVAGDTEVRDALFARANHYVDWGRTDKAFSELEEVLTKTVGVASKIDVLFTKLRLSLSFIDTRETQHDPFVKQYKQDLDKAKVLIEDGGDWERKNALSVYESIYLMMTRQFTAASKLLLNAVSTFTSLELFTYRTFVYHTCLLALISVSRETLYTQLLKSPEILSVLDQIPHVNRLVTSLYECRYGDFFLALNDVIPSIRESRYLAPHLNYYLRQLRCLAYSQFLASYASADLRTMAQVFGVSTEFLDRELFTFISAESSAGGNSTSSSSGDTSSHRIHAKINAVENRIDMERAKEKNRQYSNFITSSDLILNRMHKLMKVCSI